MVNKNNLNYQQLKTELDEVVSELQHESTDIDKAIELHKKGKELLKQLDNYLNKVTSEEIKK